jgi:hypothetical protein
MKTKPKQLKMAKAADILIEEMARETADMINYIGLDAPSDASWQGMDDILDSFECQVRAKALRKKLEQMTWKEVTDLEKKVNALLETGKYD